MNMKLEFEKWGTRWFEALPLGNGHLGAMLYGNPCCERIDLSENTFFSGDNKTNNNKIGASDAFYKMRKDILDGNNQKALLEAKDFIGIRGNYGTNIPVANIFIDYNLSEEQITDYSRTLDISNGLYEASYHYKNNRFDVKSYASHPDRLLVYQLRSDDKIMNPIIRLNLYSCVSKVEYFDDSIIFTTSAREKVHSDGTSGTQLMGKIQIETDGRIGQDKEEIRIEKASYLYFYLKMITDFDNPDFINQCMQLRSNPDIFPWDMEECRIRHINDVASYMNRSELQLSGDDQEALNTVTRMYQYGRYLLLSSSREDSKLPAHLQGIWNDNVACRIGWTCDMHLDINTQMNYWPSEVTNLSEVNEPLFRWIREKLVLMGTESARNNYGLEGWIAEIVSNSWGFTAPYWAEPISPCPTGGVWILTHIWEHYLYTGDKDYLRDNFYVIKEAARFFADYVFWNPDLEHYVSGPAISPENSFLEDDKVYQMDNGCTYELLMIRELFSIYLEGAAVLQLEDELADKVKERLPKLLPYPILEDGGIGEWSREYKEADPQHRHTSHLLGLFPFHQITPDHTPELAKAAKLTIEKKLVNEECWEETGWARNMLILYSARLFDGNAAYYHIRKMMENLVEANQLVYHPPTRGAMSFDNVYELDGNTGLTAAIAEMLLQSHNGNIHILPALPQQWNSGYVKGLRARGNILVNIKWSNGELIYAELTASDNREYKVRYRENETICRLKVGKKIRVTF